MAQKFKGVTICTNSQINFSKWVESDSLFLEPVIGFEYSSLKNSLILSRAGFGEFETVVETWNAV